MGIISRTLNLFNNASNLTCRLKENFNPVYKFKINGRKLRFNCPNQFTLYRVQTLKTKEPETLEWIENFKSDEILFDVGANIGIYSIYAASRDIQVFSFEPEALNFAELNKNININNYDNRVVAYNIALSDNNEIGILNLSVFEAGRAFHSFGESIDDSHKQFNPCFKQGCYSFTVDSLIDDFSLPVPNHIKIDVDGLEAKVIDGMRQILINRHLKSLLIEFNEELDVDLKAIRLIKKNGFNIVKETPANMILSRDTILPH